ncbi:ABC transporter permease [uncultured Corynebacterium sp.]|uniref:ABC transporter permease n=1 Tax=uncultured Corynebacterium sp. TaxID=159447 RepID=UPI0025E73D05|nr:ABC transporter permease [uncultured Corynebacterium sp.]
MSPTRHTTDRFAPGTFSPRPAPAPAAKLLRAQARIESLLFLRHGEQQLLTLVIPVGMLIVFSLLPVTDFDDPVDQIYPMTLGIALMGAGFTGQSIAVAFDRRYGALKRIGASGVPTWALIGGKLAAVLSAVTVQLVLLTTIAVFLGWRPDLVGTLPAAVFILIGAATFTSLGLLLGGTLGSDLVLALGNTLWFLLMGAAVVTVLDPELPEAATDVLDLLPSVALTHGLVDAAAGSFNVPSLIILLVWGVGGTLAALRWFSFTMDGD